MLVGMFFLKIGIIIGELSLSPQILKDFSFTQMPLNLLSSIGYLDCTKLPVGLHSFFSQLFIAFGKHAFISLINPTACYDKIFDVLYHCNKSECVKLLKSKINIDRVFLFKL